MSQSINPSSIMLYKIVEDYKQTGRTIHLINELDYFAEKVIDYANTISTDLFVIKKSSETEEELSLLCDFSGCFCELNKDKYEKRGIQYAQSKIACMPYSLRIGANEILKHYNEERKQLPRSVSITKVCYSDGESLTSVLFLDKGKIVIDDERTK